MTTLAAESAAAPAKAPYRAVPYAIRRAACERRADGTLILRSPLTPKATCRTGFAGYIPHWASRRGDLPAFCERDARSNGGWKRITWSSLWQQVQAVGAGLLELGLGLVERCAPLITDAVICGHDQDYIAALAWPNVAACQRLLPELAGLSADELVAHPALVAAIAERLRQDTGSASLRVQRPLLRAAPPPMDANEIADKG